MENEFVNLSKNIEELGKIELNDASINLAIFNAMTRKCINERLDFLKNDLNANMKLYNVKPEKVRNQVEKILSGFEEELYKIVEQYKFRFNNIQLELQEIESNQKIALANFCTATKERNKVLKSNDIKLRENWIEYQNNANACIKKYNDYNELINECLIEFDICKKEFLEAMDKSLTISQEKGLAKTQSKIQIFINKIRFLFSGKSKFENNVIERRKKQIISIEISNEKLIEETQNKITNFTATMSMIRDNINHEFRLLVS